MLVFASRYHEVKYYTLYMVLEQSMKLLILETNLLNFNKECMGNTALQYNSNIIYRRYNICEGWDCILPKLMVMFSAGNHVSQRYCTSLEMSDVDFLNPNVPALALKKGV